MTGARLKHYGWGREGEGMTAAEQAFVLGRYRAKFSRDAFEAKPVPRLEDLVLRAPRVSPPASLAAFCTTDRYDRVAHAYGKSYPDYVRAMLGNYDCAPDVVAYPRNEAEISAVMDWAGGVSASLTPFGGGSSVCGGVEPRADGVRYKAAVTLDLRHLGKVVEVDQTSRAALIEGGVYGPRWKTSSSRMASRCGIFRRVSNIRPWAAGSRRDRAVISRASTPISTISSKACAW